ncbi:hypothetical protein MNEG_10316, partial [Monoraphidium neglectum]
MAPEDGLPLHMSAVEVPAREHERQQASVATPGTTTSPRATGACQHGAALPVGQQLVEQPLPQPDAAQQQLGQQQQQVQQQQVQQRQVQHQASWTPGIDPPIAAGGSRDCTTAPNAREAAAPVLVTSASRARRRPPPAAVMGAPGPAAVAAAAVGAGALGLTASGRAARAGAGGRMAQILRAEDGDGEDGGEGASDGEGGREE